MAAHKRRTQRQTKKRSCADVGLRFRPDRRELLHALESLYTDQLKPTSRTLRRRIGEHASGLTMEQLYGAPDGGFQNLPNIDLAHLQSLCRSCSCIQVQMEEGGDWSAVFNDRPQVSVDIYNPKDPFSAGFWQSASKYFDGLSASNMFLPGSRYACAQALDGRKLEFLFNYTLGQVCHMVEIAISRRKLLGYCNDAIVPYSHSLLMKKEQCAEKQRRFTPAGSVASDAVGACQASPVLPPATLEVARHYLREILQANTVVPLSNIKRIFRTHYQIELSETLLGHSRLSDLLQDVRFQDLCTVQLQQNGYVVIAQNGLQEAPVLNGGQDFSCVAVEVPRLELAALLPMPVPSPAAVVPVPLPSSRVPQRAQVRRWSTWQSSCQKEAATSHHQQLQLDCEGSLRGRDLSSNISFEPQSWPQHSRDECVGLFVAPTQEEEAASVAGQVTISLSLATPLPSPGVPTSATRRGWFEQPWCNDFCQGEPLCQVPTPLASPGVPGSAMTRKWADLSQQSNLTRSDSCDSTLSGSTLVSMVSFPWEASGISTTQDMFAGPADNLSRNASIDRLQRFDCSTQLLHATEFSASFAESGEKPQKEQNLSTPRRHSRLSPQLGSESRTLGLEVFPKKKMVSPKVPFDLQPTSLSAQAGRLGLTIQDTFNHTATVPLAPSSSRVTRSSSTPPKVYHTTASGLSFGDQARPLDLVSSVGKAPQPSDGEAIAQAKDEEAMAVEDHAATTHTICDDMAAAKADADADAPRRNVRSARLLELMPACCRTLFHSTTAPASALSAA